MISPLDRRKTMELMDEAEAPDLLRRRVAVY
jgi:hypothetical protein